VHAAELRAVSVEEPSAMRNIGILVVALLGGLAAAPHPAAAIRIGFVPVAQTVGLGANVAVDVVVSGLEAGGGDEIVAAFDLDVSYDPLVVAATGVSFGSALGALGLEVLTGFDLATLPGVVDLAALSLLADADLAALQGDSITLATLQFSAVALGTSALVLLPAAPFGIDVKGAANAILTFETVETGAIHVVPEPSTLLLLAAGLLGLARRRSASDP
jgi:ABC-type thiamin/hydroxymethylpyrimidine transport system permease subunit